MAAVSGRRASSLLVLLSLVAACRGDVRLGGDAGITDGGGEDPSAFRAGEDLDLTSANLCPSGPPLSPPAEWSGHGELAEFGRSGSNRIRITLPGPDGKGGWVLFGNAPAMPAPTSADTCYPGCAFRSRTVAAKLPRWHEGIRYPIVKSEYAERRMRLSINVKEPWKQWCRLQQPVRLGTERHGCHDPKGADLTQQSCGGGSGQDEGECCRAILCSEAQACRCDEQGCDVSVELGRIDLFLLEDDMMSGVTDDGIVVGLQPSDTVTGPRDGGTDSDGGNRDGGIEIL